MRRPDYGVLITMLGVLFLVSACGPAPAPDRTRFDSPDDAAKAVMQGLKTNNVAELKAIFGPAAETDMSSGDPVSDRNDRETMALAMERTLEWNKLDSGRMELIVGDEKWPFPVPLAKVRGGWQFDADAGVDELLSRRIGRNELRVIDLCRDYVAMQKAYASRPRDGKVAGLYAQAFLSAPGRQDGLYWEVGPEETPSPLNDVVERASAEGYGDPSTPTWGYRFRVLTAQGPDAKGGARSYIVDGEMSGGFGLIAYPTEYGHSGIMTFIVNQDGVVYQADLGADTEKSVSGLTAFNPEGGWSEVTEPSS
jgi:hypothetical protein